MKRLWGIVSLIVLLCTGSMAVNAQTSNQELFNNNITMEKNNEKVTAILKAVQLDAKARLVAKGAARLVSRLLPNKPQCRG